MKIAITKIYIYMFTNYVTNVKELMPNHRFRDISKILTNYLLLIFF